VKYRIKEKHRIGQKPFRVQKRFLFFFWVDYGYGGYGMKRSQCEDTINKLMENDYTIKERQMEFVYKLFKYEYKYYVQGSEDWGVEYVLLRVPESATFNNNRSTLINERHKEDNHEIDIDSVQDLTIKF